MANYGEAGKRTNGFYEGEDKFEHALRKRYFLIQKTQKGGAFKMSALSFQTAQPLTPGKLSFSLFRKFNFHLTTQNFE